MKISSKVRNGLAAMIYIAKNYDKDTNTSLISISNALGISKIYLEQAFLLLKREDLVVSTKGPKGGYSLKNAPKDTSIYSIIKALDNSLFEKTQDTVGKSYNVIEKTMQNSIFNVLDKSIKETLENISLEQIILELEQNETDDNSYMYYL